MDWLQVLIEPRVAMVLPILELYDELLAVVLWL
jgi:hypothetical protein